MYNTYKAKLNYVKGNSQPRHTRFILNMFTRLRARRLGTVLALGRVARGNACRRVFLVRPILTKRNFPADSPKHEMRQAVLLACCCILRAPVGASAFSVLGAVSRGLQELFKHPKCSVDAYRRNGFAVCPNLLNSTELQGLRTEMTKIARGQLGEVAGLSTNLPSNESEAAIIGRYLAFHHPHKLSSVLQATLQHVRIVAVLRKLLGTPNIKAMQSMYFVKGPGKPGQAWHQDEHYIPTRDRSLVGAWLAVEDADVHNGCLWMHPGSHRAGVLYAMGAHDDARFDATGEAHSFPYAREGGEPCEVRAGTVIFFNGYVLHRSLPNTTPNRTRQALVVHYMSAESLLPWDADGTIVPKPDDNRDVVLVSGTDPYSFKGYVDNLTRPFIRADKGSFGRDGSRGAAAILLGSTCKSS